MRYKVLFSIERVAYVDAETAEDAKRVIEDGGVDEGSFLEMVIHSVEVDEAAGVPEHRFFECGGCDHLHPFGWGGDCRDDAQRYSLDQLDDDYGDQGWVVVDESTGKPTGAIYGYSL